MLHDIYQVLTQLSFHGCVFLSITGPLQIEIIFYPNHKGGALKTLGDVGCGRDSLQALTSDWPPSPTGQTELRFPSSQPGGRLTPRGSAWKWVRSPASLSWRSLSKAEKRKQGHQLEGPPQWTPFAAQHMLSPLSCCCQGTEEHGFSGVSKRPETAFHLNWRPQMPVDSKKTASLRWFTHIISFYSHHNSRK